MRMDYVTGLPYVEIAPAMAASPHARHMAGSLLALCPFVVDEGAIARACMSPEFARSAATCQQDEVAQALIAFGAIEPKRVQDYAEKVFSYTIDDDEPSEKCQTSLLALGSPLLGDKVESMKSRVGPCQWSENDVVESALWGNPLVHGENRSSPAVTRGGDFFFQNAAIFGNLSNPIIQSALEVRLSSTSGQLWNPKRSAGLHRALHLRRDVPERLIVAMSDSPQNTPALHRVLSATDGYRRLAAAGKLPDIKLFDSDAANGFQGRDGVYVATPDATPERISLYYNQSPPGSSKRDSLLLAAQCPEEHYLAAKAAAAIEGAGQFVDCYVFAKYSPWAAKHHARGNLVDFLRETDQIESGVAWLCLPSIPFAGIRPQDMSAAFSSPCSVDLGLIVGAMRSRVFADALPAMKSDIADFAQLFSPYISGRRLDDFARRNPEFAGLAACHPNGADIPLSAVLPEHRNVVDNIRTPVLGGRASVGSSKRGPEIVL